MFEFDPSHDECTPCPLLSVNNFQDIRNELFEEVEEIKEREVRDIQMHEFAVELERQHHIQ